MMFSQGPLTRSTCHVVNVKTFKIAKGTTSVQPLTCPPDRAIGYLSIMDCSPCVCRAHQMSSYAVTPAVEVLRRTQHQTWLAAVRW